MADGPLTCVGCGRPLTRVDRVGVSHTIFDGDVYRWVNVGDEPLANNSVPLASEVYLQCGWCLRRLDPAAAAWFYRRLAEAQMLLGGDSP